MPSVTIRVDLEGVRLPLEDKHILQGVLYALLSENPGLSAAVHDEGLPFGRHSYKLFTFSGLRGPFHAAEGHRYYTGPAVFEFRSPEFQMCETISDAVNRRRLLRLGAEEVGIEGMVLSQQTFYTEALNIRMLTPVTVHQTLDDGFTRYYQPAEPEFARMIAENFARKYIACYGQPPEESVLLLPRLVGPEDRVVTRFKGTIVKGCLGRYLLRGRPEYLTFLYDCGLGDRNSQGFGMFEGEWRKKEHLSSTARCSHENDILFYEPQKRIQICIQLVFELVEVFWVFPKAIVIDVISGIFDFVCQVCQFPRYVAYDRGQFFWRGFQQPGRVTLRFILFKHRNCLHYAFSFTCSYGITGMANSIYDCTYDVVAGFFTNPRDAVFDTQVGFYGLFKRCEALLDFIVFDTPVHGCNA